ncbi:HAD family hydrolase [Pseudarthrobacter sp. P1]|uniref:HAD family hydrolase n=1 Tax=Pseudarthrobacter sp. P1 TaxID=3418418 RepID=UPI003CEF6E99
MIVFDVNETLSDMSPMADRFAEVGAPASLAREWFAGVLRDGFALAAAGGSGAFAVVGAESLRGLLGAIPLTRGLEAAVDHIMGGLRQLGVHPDVVPGIRALTAAGFRLVTLTNGSTRLAEGLFADAGIRSEFEQLLSVENAAGWKPMRAAYDYAAYACGVETAQMLLGCVS